MAGLRKWVQVWSDEEQRHVLVEVDPKTYRPRVRSMSDTDRLISESHYDGAKALDGTPIDTRSRHKRYMEEHGVCHAGDFSMEWYANRRKEIERDQRRELHRTVREVVPAFEE